MQSGVRALRWVSLTLMIGGTGCSDTWGNPTGSPTPSDGTDATPTPAPTPDDPEAHWPDPPKLPDYSHGVCPVLQGGPTSDTGRISNFKSGEDLRAFKLIVPKNYDPTEDYKWPVLFFYHWLNASSSSVIREGDLETAAEQMKFLVVAPDDKEGGLLNEDHAYVFNWPFAEEWGAESELTFFDDMLTCVDANFNIDRRRIGVTGVSSGALWAVYLASTEHVDYISSVISISGGLGEVLGDVSVGGISGWKMEYRKTPNKYAGLMVWGGEGDWLGVDFTAATKRYKEELLNDSHVVVDCSHDGRHAIPPVEPPAPGVTRFKAFWDFMFLTPWGEPNAERFVHAGIPADWPDWCTVPPGQPK